jgi:hypothetical protein
MWWWQWQMPYRTLQVFLHALEKGDIKLFITLLLPRNGITESSLQNLSKKPINP